MDNDYPERIVVALSEDGVIALQTLCDNAAVKSAEQGRQDHASEWIELRRRLRLAQLEAFKEKHG